jgi:hypothetical protein
VAGHDRDAQTRAAGVMAAGRADGEISFCAITTSVLSGGIRVLLILGATALCAACSKPPSAAVVDEPAQPATSQATSASPAKEVDFDIAWEKAGIGETGIPVLKGLPLFPVFVVDSGGAHCCQEIEVYDPVTGDKVFDSNWYGLDGRIRLVDLDGNGTAEIVQNLTSFHYYDGMCYAFSPWVEAILTYDMKARKFVPANQQFPRFWKDTLDEARNTHSSSRIIPDLATAKDSNEFERIREMEARAVERAANLILAGHEEETFVWLARQFEPEEGRRVCRVLRDTLEAEGYYLHVKKSKPRHTRRTPVTGRK